MTDVLVIGGGLAGWRAAEAAAKAGASVALVANGAGNSPDIHALNVPVGPGDSVELFIEDTLRSGRGHCERALVEVLCRGALALADEFPWDRRPDGSLDMLQPVGCSVPRCVSIGHHIGALALAGIRKALAGSDISKKCPQSGRFVETPLPEKSACFTEIRGRVTALRRTGTGFEASVNFVETPLTAATARRTSQSGRDAPTARPLAARAVVLATGGWCGKYEFSDNPPELRGDGIALAQSLGAAVRDMDAVQYEPTVALAPAAVRRIPVITTMLHEGATFRNARGEEFLADKRANKDELSRAIFAEIAAGRGVENGVLFDATGVDPDILRTRYADTFKRYLAAGVDITREPMLVAPAPHTSLGGVCIDARCRVLSAADGAPIPGLFAAGEITGGIHGLNRIGGNAGTEVLVFGRIAGREAASDAGQNG